VKSKSIHVPPLLLWSRTNLEKIHIIVYKYVANNIHHCLQRKLLCFLESD
jgi:hypothetical protein